MSRHADIFAVVSTHRGAYKLAIYCDETVPPFGPTLPNPPYFTVRVWSGLGLASQTVAESDRIIVHTPLTHLGT